MITRIGLGAGDIWNYLEKYNHQAHLNDMVNALGRDRDLMLMSVGWLAREGHVVLEEEGPNYLVRLS